MVLIDAYTHISLPRQTSAESMLRIMDENAVAQALVCTAESCPHLAELGRALLTYPQRLRVAGLPIGATPDSRRESLAMQMAAGFIGARLGDRMVAREPALLDAIGKSGGGESGGGGIAIMVGGDGYQVAAAALLAFLDRYPHAQVWGAHFAGPIEARVLETDRAVAALFDHPRFAVVCSRHGAQDPAILEPWTRMLIARLGWSRLLFGSEYPVAIWRDELYAETIHWIDRFNPSAGERQAYLHDNARRLLFSRPAPPAHRLPESLLTFTPDPAAMVTLFPNTPRDAPLTIRESAHQQLLERYLALPPASRGRYSEFVSRALGGEI
jgi:hypothetical protein